MSRFSCRKVVYTLLVFGFINPASAQVNTSSISGIVTDESGSVVPNVTITATQEGTGSVRTTKNAENGEYTNPQLSPGRFEVRAEATGFQSAVANGLSLDIAQRVFKLPARNNRLRDIGTQVSRIRTYTYDVNKAVH